MPDPHETARTARRRGFGTLLDVLDLDPGRPSHYWHPVAGLVDLHVHTTRAEKKLEDGVDAGTAVRVAGTLKAKASHWSLNRRGLPDPLADAIMLAHRTAEQVLERLRDAPPDPAEHARLLLALQVDATRQCPLRTLDESPVLLGLASTRYLPRHLQELLATLRIARNGDGVVVDVPRWAADQLLIGLGAGAGFDGRCEVVSAAAATPEQRRAAAAEWLVHRHDTGETSSDLATCLALAAG